ncbi:Evolutionarily conserved C-terminal region 5 [Hirschfeldia incana]|nr:Evolutionarily conserved C-terminal region 5 [Hirschfeldia incana]KAJ0263932.1 Evolutionarily conserved C-terminal region 5 [Hirschfeldia incana]
MATTPSHATDLISSEEQPANLDIMKEEQPVPANSEPSQESAVVVHPAKVAPLSGPYGITGDLAGYLPSSILSPQAQGFYYRGYENPTGEWDEYSSYVNVEGLDITSPVGFNENASVVYQTGYGYNPQMPYGPYSPAASPLPSEGQLYSPQQFPFSGASPYYHQQVVPPSMQYISSPTQPDLTSLVGVDQQGDNNMGPRPSYHPHPIGPFNGNQPNLGFPEWQQGFDGGIWSDWSKSSDMHRHSSAVSPALSPQPLGSFGSYGHNIPMGSQRQRSFYGYGSGSNSYNNRGYMHSGGGRGQGSNYGSRLVSNVGMGNQSWIGVDNIRGRGRVSDPSSLGGGYNGNFDILNEQNRGPRASKPKTLVSEELDASSDTKKNNKVGQKEDEDSNNNNDFVTDYNNAKLFIIKSYSEDNVHKSIKYNVWASTANGNKKLDAAYREAKEEKEPCPVFLLFSVNASSQFCGVAEMIGPVDFEKSVDYWQQDKWTGQFPVKWHIIKDVPNSQFRHIILENNDNKPVTNSRDTQEVKLEQGTEMLKIFKSYDAETSILDDFEFYEEREKIIQERKARRQPSLLPSGVVGESEDKPSSATALQTDLIKNMSKSFAQVVRLDEGSKEAGKTSPSPGAVTATVSN